MFTSSDIRRSQRWFERLVVVVAIAVLAGCSTGPESSSGTDAAVPDVESDLGAGSDTGMLDSGSDGTTDDPDSAVEDVDVDVASPDTDVFDDAADTSTQDADVMDSGRDVTDVAPDGADAGLDASDVDPTDSADDAADSADDAADSADDVSDVELDVSDTGADATDPDADSETGASSDGGIPFGCVGDACAEVGEPCIGPADCRSTICNRGVCAAPSAFGDPFLVGSWGAPIRVSETRYNPFSCEDNAAGVTGWKRIDAEATEDMLIATGQNLMLQPIRVPATVDLDACAWVNLNALLDELDDGDQDPGGERALDGLIVVAELPDNWTPSQYIETVRHLRTVAVDHPRLAGVLVDDFMEAFESPEAPPNAAAPRLALSDMSAIRDAAHDDRTDGPELHWWPYMADSGAIQHLVPSVILGVDYCSGTPAVCGNGACELFESERCPEDCGERDEEDAASCPTALADYYLYPEDVLAVDIPIDSLEASGEVWSLDWLQFSKVAVFEGRPIVLRVLVNDEVVGTVPLDEAGLMGEHSIGDLVLDGPEHVLSFQLVASEAAATRSMRKYLYLMDIRLVREDGLVTQIDPNGAVDASVRGPAGGRVEWSYYAGSNRPWYIGGADAIDGFAVKTTLRNAMTDMDVHERFIEFVCRTTHALDQRCFEVIWGTDFWEPGIDLFDQLATGMYLGRMQDARAWADGLIIWQLRSTDYDGVPRGVLVEREVPASRADWDVVGAWPAETGPLPGWYQAWTFGVSEPADGTLHIRSEYETSTNFSAEVWAMNLRGGPRLLGRLLIPPSGRETDLDFAISEEVFAVAEDREVQVQVRYTPGPRYGSLGHIAFFDMTYAGLDIDLADRSEVTFTSGYAPSLAAIADCIFAFYLGEDIEGACTE